MIGNITATENKPAWMTAYTWAWLQSVPPNEPEKRSDYDVVTQRVIIGTAAKKPEVVS
jgi:hypothetical protein